MASGISPFLYPGTSSTLNRLSIVHLKRDLQTPTILQDHDEDEAGYAEGKVVNTRFGSFPHSTLIDIPWGSQVRASRVDTGSRGRKVQDKKRKRQDVDDLEKAKKLRSRSLTVEDAVSGSEASTDAAATPAVEEIAARGAATGFIHLLPPTPENWTSSLPHRTQVVYTPDYSYILHRIRARPGSRLIEAGAGSGSFTHASVRAVYNGYPEAGSIEPQSKRRKLGKVWSYEFHEQRHEKLVKELQDHGLDGIVQITHRDVCGEGFLVDGKSPEADAVFLDLPAPWLALPHLTRSRPIGKTKAQSSSNGDTEELPPFVSPLNPRSTVHICTFSPCIEQVQKTVSVMRQLGWVDIEMVEVAAKRIDVRRERIGLDTGDQRGTLAVPASVDEAVSRLEEIEGAQRVFHENGQLAPAPRKGKQNPHNKQAIIESLVERKAYKEGRLIHRTEPDIKTHTSYLVFAILPMEWSGADEDAAVEKWSQMQQDGREKATGMSRKQMKKAEGVRRAVEAKEQAANELMVG